MAISSFHSEDEESKLMKHSERVEAQCGRVPGEGEEPPGEGGELLVGGAPEVPQGRPGVAPCGHTHFQEKPQINLLSPKF